MNMRTPFLFIVGTALNIGAAGAQTTNCRAITDSLERLRCYDAQDATPAPAAKAPKTAVKAAPAEDPFITAAKTAVRKQLREPGSAAFDHLKVRSDAGGNKGVCGTINSRNAMGGMTGPKLFVFNGQHARVLVLADGAENGTSLDRTLLGVMLGESLKMHDQFCKS